MDYYRCEGADCGYVAEGPEPESCPECGHTFFLPVEEEYISGYGWYTLGRDAEARDDWVRAAEYYARGVEQSDEQAVHWYSLSAEQQFPRALYCLGLMYEQGRGAEQSWERVALLYRAAAAL